MSGPSTTAPRAPDLPTRAARLPRGFTVQLSHDTVVCDDGRTLFGGSTGRFVHLKPAAQATLAGRERLVVSDGVSAVLARLLLDRGLADPSWDKAADDTSLSDVTVVVPAHGRPDQVSRLLASIPAQVRVIVVDDGSSDPDPLRVAAERGGAEVARRDRNGGPAAARNIGLAAVRTPFVAFLDSDVVPARGALAHLRRHFDDPQVAVVAPRVLGLSTEPADRSWLARYEAARSSLDLGAQPGRVQPHSRIGYVPSAALMARTEALGAGFEESMRVAEDVDLIWRVHESGWLVRYDPGAIVHHEHRTDTSEWLSRKSFYGTGAALLAKRHGESVAPMVLTPWTAVVTGALLAQRRWSLPVAGLATAATIIATAGRLRRSDRPLVASSTMVGVGLIGSGHQAMSALTRHYWPLAVGAAIFSSRARRALAVAAVLDSVLDHRRTGADLDPVRYLAARRLDDLAYGTGLWWGAIRAGSPRALVPALHGMPRLPGLRRSRPSSATTAAAPSEVESTHGQ